MGSILGQWALALTDLMLSIYLSACCCVEVTVSPPGKILSVFLPAACNDQANNPVMRMICDAFFLIKFKSRLFSCKIT